MTVPAWLAVPHLAEPPATKRVHPFLDRTVRQVGAVISRTTDHSASIRRDPRVTVLAMVVWLVACGLVRQPHIMIVALIVTFVVVAVQGRSALRLVGALAVPVAVFTTVLIAPSALSVVRPGTVVVTLWSTSGAAQGLTASGITTLVLMVSRALISAAVVVIVTTSTSWMRLMAGLRGLGVPGLFIEVATMAHRYVVVLAGTLVDTVMARTARSLGAVRTSADVGFAGATLSATYTTMVTLADDVHQAMVARGFTGRLQDPEPAPVRAPDVAWGLGVACAAATLLIGDRLVG